MKKTSEEKSERLFKAIKAGELEVSQKNVNAVKKAYAESVYWYEAFRQARLEELPDPDGVSSYPEVFEKWLVRTFASELDPEEEIRKRLALVREAVIKSIK